MEKLHKTTARMPQEMKDKRHIKELAEGYLAMAEEQKKFADMAAKIEHEVVPEWK